MYFALLLLYYQFVVHSCNLFTHILGCFTSTGAITDCPSTSEMTSLPGSTSSQSRAITPRNRPCLGYRELPVDNKHEMDALIPTNKQNPKKYVHRLWSLVYCCGWVEVGFNHSLHCYFTGTGYIHLPQCQWSDAEDGLADQSYTANITTTSEVQGNPVHIF